MKNQKSKSAFTMIELVFVIVVIGILAAVAIPRLAATRDDAEITKARTTVASIRNALAMERQKRILRGQFGVITALTGNNANVFDTFQAKNSAGNVVDTTHAVLEYPLASSTNKGHWSFSNGEYKFNSPAAGNPIFIVDANGRFVCKATSDCSALLD